MKNLKVGDKVQVIKYGQLEWIYKTEYQKYVDNKLTNGKLKPDHIYKETNDLYWYDDNFELIGQIGIIDKLSVPITRKGVISSDYSVSGITGKHAWYTPEQLKFVGKATKEELLNMIN